MQHEPLTLAEVAVYVAIFVPPLVLAAAVLVARLRLRLPSLWWLLAWQVWTGLAVPISRLLMMRWIGPSGLHRLLMQVWGLPGILPGMVSFVLFLVFILLLMRDVRRLMQSQRPAAGDAPAPIPPPDA